MWHIVTMFWFSVHVFCWLITCALSIFSVLDNFCQIAPLHSNAVWMTRVLHLIWNAHTHILLFGGKFHKQCMCKCSIYKSKNQKYREKKIKNIEKIGYFRNCTHHHPCLLAASICRVVNDTFFSLFKYKIQNTLENMYLKYLYQILLNWFWKYKILFSKCISNTKYMRTGNCLFVNSWKRHYRSCSQCETEQWAHHSERSGCKIVRFHSRKVHSWTQQVSNLRYSNPIVNQSFKFHIFYNHKFTMLNVFTKFYKIGKKTTWNHA